MARFALVSLIGLTLLAISGCDPKGRRAGTWLTGTVVTTPVNDWTFTDDHDEIFVETNTWYFVPHSVTTTVVTSDGVVRAVLYQNGGEFPSERIWNKNVARDPNVRLKIGEHLRTARRTRH
jgi:hypothetical protein